MKTSITLRILHHTVTVLVKLSAIFKIFFCTLSEIIFIHKIISRIIRWVNINHLYFAKICFLQKFQHFKIIALNIKIFCIIKIYTATTAI